jgi:hypothetical protein
MPEGAHPKYVRKKRAAEKEHAKKSKQPTEIVAKEEVPFPQ